MKNIEKTIKFSLSTANSFPEQMHLRKFAALD